jgi:hypothetical protein
MIHSSVVALFPSSKYSRYCIAERIGYNRSWHASGYHRGTIAGRGTDLLFATACKLAGGLTRLLFSWNPGLPGTKQPKREADHSAPSFAKIKNMWNSVSTPSYVFLICCSGTEATCTSKYMEN